MPHERYPGLDINEDMQIKTFTWRGEVVQYILLLALLVAALLGLFGSGWLSSRELSSPAGGIEVEYERFQRMQRPTSMRVRFTTGTLPESGVAFSRDILDDWEIQSVSPDPTTVMAGPEEVDYRFAVDENGSQTEAVFNLVPERSGPRKLRVRAAGEDLTVNVFVYP